MATTSPSLAQLMQVQTTAQYVAQIKAFLSNPGNGLPPLPANGWGITSMGTWFTESQAAAMSSLSQAQAASAQAGFLRLAGSPELNIPAGQPGEGTSPWLDILAQNQFQLERLPAVTTVLQATLTAAANVGPVNVATGRVTFTDGNGNFWANSATTDGTTSGSIPTGGGAVFTFTCTAAGAAGNASPTTAVTLTTSMPGVTARLGVSPFDPGTSCITSAGADVESNDSLIARCQNRWGELGTGSPQGAWINWCHQASSEVRFATTVPTGLGSVQVVVWGANSNVSPDGLSAIEAFIRWRMPNVSFLAPGLKYVPGDPGTYNVANSPAIQLVTAIQLWGPASAQQASVPAVIAALTLLVAATPVGGFAIEAGTPDTYGISNSDMVTACTDAAAALTKVVVSVNNNSTGLVAGADFVMPPAGGLPVVARAPADFVISWTSV